MMTKWKIKSNITYMVAILDNIRSMHNVGSIFRTADAAGIKKLYLCGFTPTPVDRFGIDRIQISKVALGAEKSVDWEKKKSIIRTINILKKKGFLIIAIEQDEKSTPYFKIKNTDLKKYNKKIAFIVGNEVNGLDKKIINECDIVAEIPMYGMKKSLNVSVAFGIITSYIAISIHTS